MELWKRLLATYLENSAYKLRLSKHTAFQQAFPMRIDPLGRHFTNLPIVIIAEYLTRLEQEKLDLGRINNIVKTARNVLSGISDLDSSLAAIIEDLNSSKTSEHGENILDFLWDAHISLSKANVDVDAAVKSLDAASKTPVTNAGLDRALRSRPEEAFAEQLARVWAFAGLTADGGESGGGIDDVLALVIEENDPERPQGASRKKWLDGHLMKIARKAYSNVFDGTDSKNT